MSHHSHPDLQIPRITRDEADVQSTVRLLEDDWINPFEPRESEFVRISTGTFPPPYIAGDLLDAHKISYIRKKSSASNPNKVVLQADRNLFANMVLVAESRHLQMSYVLSHPLGPLPWALANGDGTLRKTSKAALVRELEQQVLQAEIIPEPSATTIDGMSLVQKM